MAAKAKALSSPAFAELLANSAPSLELLDVRPMFQFNRGHIRDAINLPLSSLLARRMKSEGIDECLPHGIMERLQKAKTVVLYDSGTLEVVLHPDADEKKPLEVILKALESESISATFLCGRYSRPSLFCLFVNYF